MKQKNNHSLTGRTQAKQATKGTAKRLLAGILMLCLVLTTPCISTLAENALSGSTLSGSASPETADGTATNSALHENGTGTEKDSTSGNTATDGNSDTETGEAESEAESGGENNGNSGDTDNLATVSPEADPESEPETGTATPSNPIHHHTGEDDGTDTTTWSHVYFGSYPQSEVTDEATKSAIDAAIAGGNGTAAGTSGSSEGIDVWLGNTKYRRISESDCNNNLYFDNVENNGYRYFKWERIKWRVLQNDGSTLFVATDMAMDCKDYNDTYTSITWENCTLRSWLNNSFYQTAFTGAEQGAIVAQTVVNEDNPYYGAEGGNDTKDKVYLLSIGEVTDEAYGFCSGYSVYSDSRRLKASDYANARGAWRSTTTGYEGNCWWWLRSPGYYSYDAASVDYYGYVNWAGSSVGIYDVGVVPALHINLSSDLWSVVDDGTSGGGGGEDGGEDNSPAYGKYTAPADGEIALYVQGKRSYADFLSNKITDYRVQPADIGMRSDDGAYRLSYQEAVKNDLTILHEGHQDYVIPKRVAACCQNELSGVCRTIMAEMNLDIKDGKPYISTVFARKNDDTSAFYEITKKDFVIEKDEEYELIMSACDIGNNVTYYLAQDGQHSISSASGVFTRELYSVFEPKHTVYAYAEGSKGRTPAVELKLEKLMTDTDAQMKELLDSGEIRLLGNVQSVTTSNSDFLDELKIDLSVFKVPIGYTFEGNTLKVSIGLDLWGKEKSTKGSSVTGTKYKKDYEYSNFVKDFKELWSNPSRDLTKNYKKAKALQEKYDKSAYGVQKKTKGKTFSYLGYAEWEYINGKYVFKEGLASLNFAFEFSHSQQGFVWVVPEYTYFQAKLELSGDGKWLKAGPADLYPIEFELSVSANPELKVGGGVGFKDLASAGLWGSAALPTAFNFKKKHLKMSVEGKFGYEAKFLFIFGTKKTLLEGSVDLIDKYWGTAKQKSGENPPNSQSIGMRTVRSEEIPIEVTDRSYSEKTSEWLGGTESGGFSPQSSTGMEYGVDFKQLQTGIFDGATPKIAAAGSGMVMTFVEDDAGRNTYNRMRLMYSVYDAQDGSWSEPEPVCDDGMNDVNPVLVSDGENAYVAWQKIAKKLTQSTTTVLDVAGSTEIYLAKYNGRTGRFEEAVRVTDNNAYDYAHAIAIENGKPVIYYATCQNNDMNGTGNTIISRYKDGTNAALIDSLNYIYALKTDSSGSEFSFIVDEDGDTADNSDVKAVRCQNGTKTDILLDAPVANIAYAGIDGQDRLLLTDNSNIYYYDGQNLITVLEYDTAIAGGIESLNLDGKTILIWTHLNEDGSSDLYYVSGSDGEWSESVRLTNQDKLLSAVSLAVYDGALYGTVTKTAIDTDEEGRRICGQVDLESFGFADYADIEVDILSATETNFSNGTDCEFDVIVTNNGTIAIDGVRFTVGDTLGTEKSATRQLGLKPGETQTITLVYPVPENYAETTLSVEAALLGLVDVDPDNNRAERKIGLADLYFENTNVITLENGYVIEAYLYNASDVAAENVTISKQLNERTEETGLLQEIDSLANNEGVYINFSVEKEQLQFTDGFANVYLLAESDGEDSLVDDNVEKIILMGESDSDDGKTEPQNPPTPGNTGGGSDTGKNDGSQSNMAPPAKVSLSSAKNQKSKTAILKYKAVSGADGYEISYSTDKKFKKSVKKKNTTKTSYTLKSLKKGKTYYVRVRAYKKDSAGNKVYGAYSKVKKVKIKK